MGPQPELTLPFHDSLKKKCTVPTRLEGNLLLMEWIFLFLPFVFFLQNVSPTKASEGSEHSLAHSRGSINIC